METFSFQAADRLTLKADRYVSTSGQPKNLAILYFHGGGLMYGSRTDLPEVYKSQLLEAGYDLFAFDYPLAPETPLSGIHQAVLDCAKWFLNTFPAYSGYLLFGRSAGAYLALNLARNLKAAAFPLPKAILSFYGYYSFDAPEFHRPSPFYQKFPAIEESLLENHLKKEPVISGSIDTRYSLYVCARQAGSWPDWLTKNEKGSSTGLSPVSAPLTEDTLFKLPPTFLTASSSDEDVPFRISKQMARKIPEAIFHPVYFLEHDFDRHTDRPEGREAYKSALDWLDSLKL